VLERWGTIFASIPKATTAVAGAIVTVAVTGEYDIEMDATRGKIQAQGSDFKDAGTGKTVKYSAVGGMPLWAMVTSIEQLRAMLNDTQAANRTQAFAELHAFVQTRPWAPIKESTLRTSLSHCLRTIRTGRIRRLENWVFSIARRRLTKTLWSLFAIRTSSWEAGRHQYKSVYS
jgi:hypothetical protein